MDEMFDVFDAGVEDGGKTSSPGPQKRRRESNADPPQSKRPLTMEDLERETEAKEASQSISSANGEEALAHGLSESSSNLKDAPHSLDTDLPSNSADGEGEEGDDVVMMERIKCIHEVAYPSDWVGERIEGIRDGMEIEAPLNKKPARVYPFTLDPFQKASVACLEKGESVLVSAHTSAGKTVVAEYAIAIALRDKQRVIYTSPIKALSNQKYRELYEEFEDVGLMTGDVTINPAASCLVMTTEILRSMLYRGSEIMREVAWVVFDEIHYMRDKERGVVWEETLILLPDNVRFVFLSATIPNAREFADWIASLHRQPCHVVYTDYRPTPLQHYIFPAGGDGLYLVVDEKGVFRENNFQKALAQIAVAADKEASTRKGGKKRGTQGSDCFKIVKMIMERNYAPMSKLDFNTEAEKKLVDQVFSNAIDSLSEEDQKLPQVEHILPILRRGIGIHHSGLLPILKEVIEILFQEGLVKALFATETFAMGLNMPAKTVVFTSVRKFDGRDFRWVSSGEYIQMSGRAGRRGLDDRGIVILMVDEKMEPTAAKTIIKGASDRLQSQFHLGYNMLLNLLRLEGVEPEHLMRKSFHQFQNDRDLPKHQQRMRELEAEIAKIQIDAEDAVSQFHFLQKQLDGLRGTMQETINLPLHCLPYLQPGRLVKVRDGDIKWGWGVVVNFSKKYSHSQSVTGDTKEYVVDVLLNCAKGERRNPYPAPAGSLGDMLVIPVLLSLVDGYSTLRVYIPKDLRPEKNRQSVGKSLREVMRKFDGKLPYLDPIEDMKIEDPSFKKLIRRIETIEDRMMSKEEFRKDDLQERLQQYEHKVNLQKEAKELKKKLRDGDQVIMKDELKARKRVLRRLGFTSNENVVQMKGRVACEINSADELLITEMMFAGIFNDITASQAVALMSCFAFQEKADENTKLKEELAQPLRQMQELARKIATVSKECKLEVDVDEYVQKFKPHMMDVVYAWCQGAKFIEICKMTDIFEGSIIRAMRRLEELLRQLCTAAKAIGNTELEMKFAEGISKIKRDIVFAVSLYL